jgi:hypothetical protein
VPKARLRNARQDRAVIGRQHDGRVR